MKTKTRLFLGWCLAIALTGSSALLADAGRMKGIVGDSDGNPLGGVVITITAADSDFEKAATTKKSGKFSLTVTDGSRAYVIKVEKEGYRTAEEPFKFEGSEVMDVSWVLYSNEEAAEHADQLQALEAKDKATKAYNLGAEAYNAGNLDGAVEHFSAAIEANTDFSLAYAALARLFLETERWDDARGAAENLVRIAPEEPLGLQMLYDSYWGAGDSAKAAEILEQLIAREPGAAVAARIFNQAVAATKKEDWATAERGFSQALELNPELFQAMLPLAQIYFSRDEFQEAVDMAESYLGHDEANARANMVRYEAYEALGDGESANAAFAELKEKSPVAAAQLFLRDGTNFYNNGAIKEATQAVETSLALDPTNPQTYYQLGLCYASAAKNNEAKANLEKFLELAPDHPEAASVRDMLTYLN